MLFEGKVAIVTGAGGGIGKAEAMLLAREGASVIINDIGRDENGSYAASVTSEIIAAGGKAVANEERIGSLEAASRIVAQALDHFGKIDVLINNAGCCAPDAVEDLTEADWDRVVDVNLKGTFAMIRAAIPHMKRARGGAILNTASEAGLGQPMTACYSAAKEGTIGLTRTVAREAGRFGIRCNAIRPRAMSEPQSEMGTLFLDRAPRWQPLMDALGPYWLGERGDSVHGWGTPAQAAPFAVWLCSDAAANVNGRTFLVGGEEICLFSEPVVTRVVSRSGGWDLAAIDREARSELVGDLENHFLLKDTIGDREL